MATITFKGKVKTREFVDGTVAYRYIQVPKLTRSHCSMAELRVHPKYGVFANSDLFEGVLAKLRREMFSDSILKLESIPENVHVDTSEFLANVTITI